MATEAEDALQMSGALPPDNDEDIVAPANAQELAKMLYARCACQNADKTFDQEDLFALGIIANSNVAILNDCIIRLTKQGLLQPLKKRDGLVCWKVVKKEEAARYKNLNDEEAVVYGLIEVSGREGVWTKMLRGRSGLHQTTLNRVFKSLEHKNLIKPAKNVQHPGRKNYMLYNLQPSEAATGGPFYTDGILDEEFVHQMAIWTEKYIIGRSWSHRPHSETQRKKGLTKLTREQAEKLRTEEISRGDVRRDRHKDMLPMPPGYTKYPTLSEITKAINASKLSGIVMKEAEMRQLLDILVWDAKVERVPSIKGYRAVRRLPEAGGSDFENGLTEAPCGRCPVFDICEDGGPVNATTCEYFEDWLNVL